MENKELEKLKDSVNELMKSNEEVAELTKGLIDKMFQSNQSLVKLLNTLLK